MRIVLSELICYIDSYSASYFDRISYRCFFENEVSSVKDSLDLLPIPKVEEQVLIDKFIDQFRCTHIFKAFDKVKGNPDMFHKIVNDHRLYGQWIDFRTSFLLDFAVNWCSTNNISYTHKYQ